MSGIEWSIFALALVVVGVVAGIVMRMAERKKPRYE
jgi:hypothetical protein